LVITQQVSPCAISQISRDHLEDHLLQVAIRRKALQPLHLQT